MEPKDRLTYVRNMTLAGIAGQAGCSSVMFVFGGLFAGLFLDSTLGTRPVFTLTFLLMSVPLSLVMMVYMVLGTTRRITPPKKKTVKPKITTDDDDV